MKGSSSGEFSNIAICSRSKIQMRCGCDNVGDASAGVWDGDHGDYRYWGMGTALLVSYSGDELSSSHVGVGRFKGRGFWSALADKRCIAPTGRSMG